MDLTVLGWSLKWNEDFLPLRKHGWIPGRVATEDKHFYSVVTEDGEVLAQIAGKLLHDSKGNCDLPKVGDWVAVARLANEEKAVIHHVLPRRTRLSRKVPGRETEEQVLATNIDVAFVVHPLDGTFNARRLQRHLVMVRESGARAIVVLNKSDLCRELNSAVTVAKASAGEATVVVASAKTGMGLDELRVILQPGMTVVVLGSSGVGKSSLINRLHGEEIQATADVRERDLKGRHVTSSREMILLPGGALIIDTPGLREFHMWVDAAGVVDAFPEIEALATICHFRECRHVGEKRCAVLEAVATGAVARERYESFLKLRGEAEVLTRSRRRRGRIERKKNTRGIQRAHDNKSRREVE